MTTDDNKKYNHKHLAIFKADNKMYSSNYNINFPCDLSVLHKDSYTFAMDMIMHYGEFYASPFLKRIYWAQNHTTIITPGFQKQTQQYRTMNVICVCVC